MKFLIAATLLCLALFGQSRAGSLRGLAVPVPHQVYGVPVLDNEIHIEETQPIVEDSVSVDLTTHKEPIVSQPSSEYGAPAVAHEIETVPFVDTLPLVDSVVSFGTPSETNGPPAKPTTPKPELPYLEPGLPALPEAPVVPAMPEVSEKYVQVSNEYLPNGKPSEVYGPSATAEIVLPTIHEIPALPEAPTTVTPAVTVEHSGQHSYETPAIGSPTPISHIPELPSLPATTFIVAVGTPSETYGPPSKPNTPKPELPYLEPGLPALPEAPVVPEVSENYMEVSNEIVLPTIHEIPALPEAPTTVTPAVTVGHSGQYSYETPAIGFPAPISHIPELPLQPATTFIVAVGTPSETYGPPSKPNTPKPELPYLEPGLPALPEAPVVPEVSENYMEVSNEIVLPTIHEIPGLPEAPTTVTPAVTVGHSGQYSNETPAIGFPTPISHIPELPSLPATAFIVAEDRPNEIYGPAAHSEHKPSGPYGAAKVPVQVPELPTAPLPTFAAEKIYGLPAKMPEYIAPAVTKDQTVPVEVPKEYFYEPPAVAFPIPVSVQPILHEIKNLPAEAPGQYFYEVPAIALPTPVNPSVSHGIVSPMVIKELKPIGQGFAIHSVAGSLENSSTGMYNQVSVVNHLMPQLSSFGTIVGHHQPVANSLPVTVPHSAYGVANF